MIQVVEFIEPDCPYCRYVYYYVLCDLQVRRDELNRKMMQHGDKTRIPPFEIKLVDIIANKGCTEEQWFQWYSMKTGIGKEGTPIVVINDKIFYLLHKKNKEKLELEKLSRTDLLKSQIISELTDVFFEKQPQLYDLERMIPETVYINQQTRV